jgi:hypothetical protein
VAVSSRLASSCASMAEPVGHARTSRESISTGPLCRREIATSPTTWIGLQSSVCKGACALGPRSTRLAHSLRQER